MAENRRTNWRPDIKNPDFARLVWENLYYLRDRLAAIPPTPQPLTVQQITQVQQNLQLGGSSPINLSGLQGATGQPQIAAFMQGTYVARPTVTTADNGLVYYAIDQDVYYQVVSGAWKYAAGEMSGTLSPDQKPTLAAGDAGFPFRSTDFNRKYVWSGTAWADFPGEDPRCEVRFFDGTENPPAAGWHVCDGSTVSRSTSIGGVTSVTVPDYSTATYVKAATVQSVGPNAASGTVANESAHTHSVDPPSTGTGGPNSTTTLTLGALPTIPVASSTHGHAVDIAPFNSAVGSSHNHAPGTVDLRNTVLKAYYRL